MFTLNLILPLLTRILLPMLFPAFMQPVEPIATVAPEAPLETVKVQWSPERRLAWDDFQGTPDEHSPHHALTAANLGVSTNCSQGKFTYQVNSIFLPTASWTKNTKSEKLLAHEQLHFDLTEVHARELRKRLGQLNCDNVKSKLNATVSETFDRWKAEQKSFDDACKHGLNATEERIWAAHIQERLQELQAYR